MDGILIVAKPVGPTSHDVVALIRRLSGTKRVGHGGTLDPFAAGVLPIFLGRATRMLEYHLGDGKAYRATVCFGATSTTDDLEGELTPADRVPTRAEVEAALVDFRGEITQVPPAYSAVKVAGRRAYAMARAGESPKLAPRQVTITSVEIVEWTDEDPGRPVAIIEVDCSAGTYIRALARDLGAAVGSGAYLGALTRSASGPFRLEAAIPLEAVREAAAEGRLETLLLPADTGLEAMPVRRVGALEIAEIARGREIQAMELPATAEPGTRFRLCDADGNLVAMAVLDGRRLAPEKVFVDVTPPAADPTRRGIDDTAVSVDGPPDAAVLAERDPSASEDPDPASPDEP